MIGKYTCLEVRRVGNTYTVVLMSQPGNGPANLLFLDGMTEAVLDEFRVGDIYSCEFHPIVKLLQ